MYFWEFICNQNVHESIKTTNFILTLICDEVLIVDELTYNPNGTM